MGDISKGFSAYEFWCHCPRCAGKEVGRPSPKLLATLQGARDILGRAITLTRGFSCRAHNAEVGGVEPSEHGNYETEVTDAADVLAVTAEERYELVRLFLGLRVPRIGVGNLHLHIGVSTTLPNPAIFPDVEKSA